MEGVRKSSWGCLAWLDLPAEDDKLLQCIADFGAEHFKETGRDFTLLIMGESEAERLADVNYEACWAGSPWKVERAKKVREFVMPSGVAVPIESDGVTRGGFVMGVDFGGE